MRAIELLNNTLKILGYSDNDGNAKLTQRIRNGAVVMMNLVYGDLWSICNVGEFKPIKSLSDEIVLPSEAMGEVFVYGLAMHIARSENDGDQQQFFAHLYNAKRAGLTKYTTVKNTWPCPDC